MNYLSEYHVKEVVTHAQERGHKTPAEQQLHFARLAASVKRGNRRPIAAWIGWHLIAFGNRLVTSSGETAQQRITPVKHAVS